MRIEELIGKASQIGGDTAKERAELLKVFEAMASDAEHSIEMLWPVNAAEAVETFREATQSSRRTLQMFSGPIAQFIRNDFPTDDIIPSVLTEDDQTISRFLTVLGNDETMETFRTAAAEIL